VLNTLNSKNRISVCKEYEVMTKEEIKNIQIGDRFYVTSSIRKRIFDGPWAVVYNPNKFYEVLRVEWINYRAGSYKGKGFKITTTSEMGINRIYVIRASKVCDYMINFCIVKEKVYKEINSVDIFDILCTDN